jgi:hypothetical protein
VYIWAAKCPETVRQFTPPAYHPHTYRLMMKHLPKALLLALLLGGCGVDYQKCEAIKGALDSAYANLEMTNKARLEEIKENYLKKCGVKPENKTTNAYLSYLDCNIAVLEKNGKQITKQTLESPDVVEAIKRTDEIVKDLKWNRCK